MAPDAGRTDPGGKSSARIVRDPLFLFLGAGLALYLAYALLQPRQQDPVVLTAGTRTTLIAEFETLTGRKATPADVDRIEREYVADELLFRAAIADNVHLADGEVRQRLIEEMRRRATGVLPDPSTEELLDFYSDHLDRYHSEPTATFEQVFFESAPMDAARILAGLQRDQPTDGDPFDHGLDFEAYGRSMLRGMFGEPFVTALWSAPENEWIGPLETARGWHFVRVRARHAPVLRPFPEVRDQVENDWIAAQIQTAVEQRVQELSRGQVISIER